MYGVGMEVVVVLVVVVAVGRPTESRHRRLEMLLRDVAVLDVEVKICSSVGDLAD